jgi:DNA-binding transcriptional MerR regulator
VRRVAPHPPTSARLLTIGEFAAATQLSPKALRLYDEHRLLQPARIDAASGYRYYGNEQVATGRLVRTLRDMNLSLADIARIVACPGADAEQLLAQLAGEVDRRYAREKRAFQSALLLLRDAVRPDALSVEDRLRGAMTVIVTPLVTDRRHFHERLRRQVVEVHEAAQRADLAVENEWLCRMLEPLADEESQLELLVPVKMPSRMPDTLTLRQLPPASCAWVGVAPPDLQRADFSAAVDVLFDWFDRHARIALDVPCLVRTPPENAPVTQVCWACQPSPRPER